MLRVGVIGVGQMGRNHARIYAELPNVEFVAVADVNTDLAGRVARQYRVRCYADYRDLFAREKLDAVSIAVPTILHCAIAQSALNNGAAVLIEKPIAATINEAREIIKTALERNLVLMVGHIERWNPAVLELKRRVHSGELGRIFQIRARRVGPFPERVRDVGVVLDLATHDLDIMHFVTQADVTRVFAEIAQKVHTNHEDMLCGVISFANDVVGVLDVNWLTPTKVRELSVTGAKGMFVANYLTQELYFYRNDSFSSEGWESLNMIRGVSEGDMVKLRIDTREPLKMELESFVDCVANKKPSPVGGEDGVRALALAQALVESGQTHRPVEMK